MEGAILALLARLEAAIQGLEQQNMALREQLQRETKDGNDHSNDS